jgi:hypothetical protein
VRVNLPHISDRKRIEFVLHRNLLKMQRSTFLSRNLNGRYLLNIKTLSFYFCSWTPKKLQKLALYLLYGEICLTKLKILPFLVEICIKDTLRMTNFKILSIFSGSWNPK